MSIASKTVFLFWLPVSVLVTTSCSPEEGTARFREQQFQQWPQDSGLSFGLRNGSLQDDEDPIGDPVDVAVVRKAIALIPLSCSNQVVSCAEQSANGTEVSFDIIHDHEEFIGTARFSVHAVTGRSGQGNRLQLKGEFDLQMTVDVFNQAHYGPTRHTSHRTMVGSGTVEGDLEDPQTRSMLPNPSLYYVWNYQDTGMQIDWANPDAGPSTPYSLEDYGYYTVQYERF